MEASLGSAGTVLETGLPETGRHPSDVFPSIFEGFGLPILESMASGVPTITSFGSSLEEVAGNGAMLIDPLDTGAMADVIGKVLGDPHLQRQLISRGLLRSAQFKQENLAQRVIEVYRSL